MGKTAILRTSLDLLYYSGASRILRPVCGGIGAIFMLHHVKPGGGQRRGFAPNGGLEVTPGYLDAAITFIKEQGYETVSLGEAARRIADGGRGRPFAVFTSDDGYLDNFVHAWPVFRKHACPFTIFVAPAIADGTCELWWRCLEAVIAGTPRIAAELPGGAVGLDTLADERKQAAFERLYWPVRAMEEHAQRTWIRDFCSRHGFDLDAYCRAQAMTWNDLRKIAADPLCTIGAHTVRHFAIAKLSRDEALAEVVASRDRIAAELGTVPRHFAYPYGDAASAGPRDFALLAEAGFDAAVTTRKGLIFSAHRDHMRSLPRVSLNGGFQTLRHLDVLLSGTAFALWNGFRRVQAA